MQAVKIIEQKASSVTCREHPGEVLVKFCSECHQMVCEFCIECNHNDHSLTPLDEGSAAVLKILDDKFSLDDF